MTEDKPHRDPEWLHEKYVDERRSMREIADTAGCSVSTVMRNMRRHGIEPRSNADGQRNRGRKQPPSVHVDGQGYVRCTVQYDGEFHTVKIHRLLAVAEYGFGRVSGMVVHHKNDIPWDNRPGNLEVMGRGEHTAYHNLNTRDYETGSV